MKGEEITVCLTVDGSSGSLHKEEVMAANMKRAFETFKKKQADYGSRNISVFGEPGVVVRANDKMQRIIQLAWHSHSQNVSDEKVEDTWLDLAVYALIALMLRQGQWE